MTIAEEMKLKQALTNVRHEALLGLLRTSLIITKLGEKFFSTFKITVSQYNILAILRDYEEGLSQSELSDRQLVNRSNITGLVDRLERRGLVKRYRHPTDRRTYQVRLTDAGRALVAEAEPRYEQRVDEIMASLTKKEAATLVVLLQKVRDALADELD